LPVFSVFVGAVITPLRQLDLGRRLLPMLGKNLGLGHGHVDFAGSSVVHYDGGVMAFITAFCWPAAWQIGSDGSVRAIPGHNIPMALVGTFIPPFGGSVQRRSTLAGSDLRTGSSRRYDAGWGGRGTHRDGVRVAQVRQARSVMLANGTLAGLVAIPPHAHS